MTASPSRRRARRQASAGSSGSVSRCPCSPTPPLAQTAADPARLVVTVTDQTGGVIPNARVTVTAQDAAMPPRRSRRWRPPRTAWRPWSVSRRAGTRSRRSFRDSRRDGARRARRSHRQRPPHDRPADREGRRGRDGGARQAASALDPQGNSFSTVLTREQIAALPDDPDEMEKALKAMAPPGAQIRVDGFTGGKLPPKSQIRSIRLPRMDQIAAQNHGGLNGLLFIDIMTQPGNGPLRGSLDFTFRDDAMNAQNPFTPVKGQESLKQGGFSLSGSIVPNKSSFSLQLQRRRSVRHDEPARGAPRRHRGRADPPSDRSHERVRAIRSEHHERPHGAVQLHPDRHDAATTSAWAATTCPSAHTARTRPTTSSA